MSDHARNFTLGIEEEYLLVDQHSMMLTETPDGMLEACRDKVGDQVSPEYLQCQIEIGTRVCADITAAGDDLRRLRAAVHEVANRYGLAPIAVSCHPFAEWKKQHHTDKERYNQLHADLGGVVRRLLICGMHIHVGLEADADRVDLMGQLSYFLPHLLALSASSPFWQGEDTRLASYRISIFDNLPRTGLPPVFDSWDAFQRSVEALTQIGVIEDASKIWWDLRPSVKFPTLETRILDVQPRLCDTLTLAATTQCLLRMLWRLRRRNQRWRLYDNFLIAENRWRAQRYGTTGGLIDFGERKIVPVPDLVEELLVMLEEDAVALDCVDALAGLRRIVSGGTSSERQRQVAADSAAKGADHDSAMRAVVRHLADEFTQDL